MAGRSKTKQPKSTTTRSTYASPLARTVATAKRRKQVEAITAALEKSQRSSEAVRRRQGSESSPASSPLARKVEESKRQRKKTEITEALKKRG